MAIQQSVQIDLVLNGDGVSTVFTYAFSKIFNMLVNGGGESFLFNSTTLPTSANVVNNPIFPSCVSTIDGFGNLVLTFSSAPGLNVVGPISVQLLFNSGTLAGTTAAWTSATALNTTWTLPLNGSNSVAVGFIVSGTITAGIILFEVSQDGANWLPIQGAIADGYTALTGWTNGVGSRMISFDVAGDAYLRLRLNPVITGSGTVTFIFQASNALAEPVPVIGQSDGTKLHMTLDDAAGGNSVNTVVKGTQAARAMGVQDLKDSGRTPVVIIADSIAGVTSEALITTLIVNKGGTVTTGQTNYSITAGKTLRIQSMQLSVRASAAAMATARARLRSAASVLATSPIYANAEASSIAAVINASNSTDVDIPDGLELAGGQQIGVSQIASATTALVSVTIIGYEY